MKIKRILLLLSLSLAESLAISQPAQVPKHPWFQVHKISKSIWRIEDNHIDNIYLVTGKDKAMLIDNGLGAVDLVDFIKKFTSLPLIVINTHGHPDHAGSDNQFDSIYANPADFGLIRRFTQPAVQKKILSMMLPGPVPDSLKYVATDSTHQAKLIALQDRQLFDLGGKKLEIIFTPGHTLGSISILDHTDKILFTGDNVNELVWMHLKESAPLDDYLKSLEKLQARKNEFKMIFPGHRGALDDVFLQEQITCAQNILSGNCIGKPYKSFSGEGLLCTYKRASIAYNPDNRFTKQ